MIAQADGAELYYEHEGPADGGLADILLVPGLGASTHVWYPQRRSLAATMRFTSVDPRGLGRSSKPAGPYTIPMLAEDLRAVIDQAGIAPAVVVASSMACMVAVELAAAHPELVRALVLVGGFPTLPEAGKQAFRERAEIAEAEGMGPLADRVVAAALGATTHETQPGLVGLYRMALLANDPRGYAANCRAIAAADVTARLPLVRCPTLVALGAEEKVAPLPAATALVQGIPGSRLRAIAAAGHLPFLEQPAAFNAMLAEFVGSLGWPAATTIPSSVVARVSHPPLAKPNKSPAQ